MGCREALGGNGGGDPNGGSGGNPGGGMRETATMTGTETMPVETEEEAETLSDPPTKKITF